MITHLRAADVEEMWAANRLEPATGVLSSVEMSDLKWCVRIGSTPAALCGVAPLGDVQWWGVPWLLATPAIKLAPVSFFRESRRTLTSCLEKYRHLINFVDARNVLSLQWLRWLGFEIRPAEPYGPDQLPFHRVIKER